MTFPGEGVHKINEDLQVGAVAFKLNGRTEIHEKKIEPRRTL